MLIDDLKSKRCLIVCGSGGVGKTTVAAAIALAATQYRKRVLVVTIDPAKRLAEAFGFSIEEMLQGGEPKLLDDSRKQVLGVPAGASLSVGILNPKYVLQQIMEQVLTREQCERLTGTALYQQLSEMVYGLQEYTAYEWVTRMINSGLYDFIVLDTPPAFHAKDFFNVPEKIKNLMESRVFQLFAPKRKGWLATFLGNAMSFPWIEKLLGAKVFSDSRLFFETFNLLRDRILERCEWLSRFFSAEEVAVVAVSTIESTAQLELEGLLSFMSKKQIPLHSVFMNQVEQGPEFDPDFVTQLKHLSDDLAQKWDQLERHQKSRAERAEIALGAIKTKFPSSLEVLRLPMVYSDQGLQILKVTAAAILG